MDELRYRSGRLPWYASAERLTLAPSGEFMTHMGNGYSYPHSLYLFAAASAAELPRYYSTLGPVFAASGDGRVLARADSLRVHRVGRSFHLIARDEDGQETLVAQADGACDEAWTLASGGRLPLIEILPQRPQHQISPAARLSPLATAC